MLILLIFFYSAVRIVNRSNRIPNINQLFGQSFLFSHRLPSTERPIQVAPKYRNQVWPIIQLSFIEWAKNNKKNHSQKNPSIQVAMTPIPSTSERSLFTSLHPLSRESFGKKKPQPPRLASIKISPNQQWCH